MASHGGMGGPPAGGMGGGGMRELRVEDALVYLDEVKMEFGDRPHIYNEFLDIMKTFKTQQIDTPGVIRRVSNLFQGNKKLVLGFNTFLPEGYKIELPMDGVGPPVAVYRAPGQTVTHILTDPSGSATSGPPPRPGQSMGGPPGVQTASSQQPGMMSQHSAGPSQPGGGAHSGAAGRAGVPSHTPSQMMSQPGVRHGGAPHPHAQHPTQAHAQGQMMQGAAMMGQQPGPKGSGMVVEQTNGASGPAQYQHTQGMHSQQQAMQMQHQVQGGPRKQQPPTQTLMAGEGAARARLPMEHQSHGPGQQHLPRPLNARSHGSMPVTQVAQAAVAPEPKVPAGPPRIGPGAQQQPAHGGAPPPGPMQPRPGFGNEEQMQQPFEQQPPMEFDHAINYVTTIKKRFASQPETYKKFLEILHTYQKEQRGIKEVLDEVSVLFADHPDLLKEFTFFLPEAVQEQAKAQLEAVVNEAEARKRAASSKQAIMQTAKGMQRQAQGTGRSVPAPTMRTVGVASQAPSVPFGATQGRTEERELEIARSSVYGHVSFAPVRPPRRNELTPAQAAAKKGRPTTLPELPLQPSTVEYSFLERVKHHLNRKELAPESKGKRHTPYIEFLKCLHLFGTGVLNKDELVLLLRGLLMQGHAPKSGINAGGGASNPSVASDAHDLLREFEEILIGRGPYADQESLLKAKSKYGSLRAREFDFGQSDRPTPSYGLYPADYPNSLFVTNSGQTDEDAAVLNNSLFCVGTERTSRSRMLFSKEEYDGVRLRRNAYEEAMFKVEDERFEFDMAIERNNIAMRQVEPIAEEVTMLRETEENDGQPIGRLQYTLKNRALSSTHIHAIGRIYGEYGDEVLEHLKRNPLAVLPIVYQRLRQKDMEWRKAKVEMIEKWAAVNEENYEGSLDYLCYFYRRKLELSFAADHLVEECKRARQYVKSPDKLSYHPAVKPFAPAFALSNSDHGALLFQPYLSVNLGDNDISTHKDAFSLLALQVANHAAKSKADRERVGRVWAEFMVPWFEYPVSWVLGEVRESYRGDLNSDVVRYSQGQRVRTAFGDGVIVSSVEGNPSVGFRYRVKLPFGVASVRPNAVIHAIPETDRSRFARKGGLMKKLDESELAEKPFAEKLEKRFKLIFGTKHVYIFLRLYSLLVSVLSDTYEHIKTTPPADDPSKKYYNFKKNGDEPTVDSTKLDYTDVLHSLHGVLKHKVDGKDFETLCRRVSKAKVYQMAALPRLLEKCADALVQVAREDALLQLYDYCQNRGMDPAHLRSQCLALVPDSSYRIQQDSSSGCMYFSYLADDEDLFTSPQKDDIEEEGADDEAMDDAEEGVEDGDDEEGVPPQAKRAKLS